MTDKTFTFEKKTPEQLCSLRKLHNTDDYIYNRRKDGKASVALTKCRECKVWLLVTFELAPSSRFTGQEAWHVVSKVATQQEIEYYTKMGMVRDRS